MNIIYSCVIRFKQLQLLTLFAVVFYLLVYILATNFTDDALLFHICDLLWCIKTRDVFLSKLFVAVFLVFSTNMEKKNVHEDFDGFTEVYTMVSGQALSKWIYEAGFWYK